MNSAVTLPGKLDGALRRERLREMFKRAIARRPDVDPVSDRRVDVGVLTPGPDHGRC